LNNLIYVALSSFAVNDPSPRALLESSGYPFQIHSTGKRITTKELLEHAKDASVILAGVEPYDASILKDLDKLRCISRLGAGVDSIDLHEAKARGIVVLNTPEIPVQAVAELTLTMMLCLCRNLRPQANLMSTKTWERLPAHLLSGKIVGVIGLGKIGRRVTRLCKAFDAEVISYDPYATPAIANELQIDIVDKDYLLRSADIISIHASRSKDHPVLIGQSEIALMKDGVIVLNLARGEMIDEKSLVEALRSGKIAGAGLDVFSKEPYQGLLCDFDQVILTPHCATLTLETRSAMENQCVENALDFLHNTIHGERRVI
jgi:D-3-phosphoglycerate dehydrogenase